MEEDARSQVAQDAFAARRDQLASTLGVPTVDLLIERSLTEIAPAFPLLRAISVEGGVLRLDSIPLAFRNATGDEVETALNALTAVMLLVLGRLLGKPVAENLAEELLRSSEPPLDDR
jgi:hypothetical protein